MSASTGKVYAIGFGDGPLRCTYCGASFVTERLGDGVTRVRHGNGEAQRDFRYPDDYLEHSDPIARWLRELHEYEGAKGPVVRDLTIS